MGKQEKKTALQDAAAAVDAVQLEEMDWQQARKQAKEIIRQGLMQVEMGRVSLAKAEVRLRELWAALPPEERAKRGASQGEEGQRL